MVYLIDPFSVGQDHPEMHRLITLGLLRCYKQMIDGLPENMQTNVYVQVSRFNYIFSFDSRWKIYSSMYAYYL